MITYQSRIVAYLVKHLRNVSGGGIAWHRRVFTRAGALGPQDLIDAAVDMAWARLRLKARADVSLDITQERGWIVFRVQACAV